MKQHMTKKDLKELQGQLVAQAKAQRDVIALLEDGAAAVPGVFHKYTNRPLSPLEVLKNLTENLDQLAHRVEAATW